MLLARCRSKGGGAKFLALQPRAIAVNALRQIIDICRGYSAGTEVSLAAADNRSNLPYFCSCLVALQSKLFALGHGVGKRRVAPVQADCKLLMSWPQIGWQHIVSKRKPQPSK